MPATGSSRPSPETLKQFQRLKSLNQSERQALAERLEIRHARPGERLLELGATDDNTLYLLDGKLELRAEDGHVRLIDAAEPAARLPISRLRPSLYRVTAKTPVKYLCVENSVLNEFLEFEPTSSILVEESYLVDESSFFTSSDSTEQLTSRLLADFEKAHLMIPSLPAVAARIGETVLQAGNNVEQITRALMLDPVLTAKILKAANQGLPDPQRTASLNEAVRQLGTETVTSVVVKCVLRETLRQASPAITNMMHAWWERSLRISAIAYVLARLSERFDPNLAALAGLLHQLGEPALLHYAQGLDEPLSERLLKEVLQNNLAEATHLLASECEFAPVLRKALDQAHDPMRDHPGEADYADILLVAERHAVIGQGPDSGPALDQMPAFRKLGLGSASPQFSLKVMQAAREALSQAEAMLGRPAA